VAYSFVICKSTGEELGEATAAKKRSFTRARNVPMSATVSLQLSDPIAPFLLPGANPRLKIYSTPTPAELAANPGAVRTLRFYGDVPKLPQPLVTISAKDDTITAVFNDPRWVLARRFALGDGTETYAGVDQGLILWNLINTQNARSGGETWIRQGATTTGTLRDRVYGQALISQLFDDMTKLLGGPDIDLVPIDYYVAGGTRAMGNLTVYASQGIDRPNAVFGYSPIGVSNVDDATLTFLDVTTKATVTGNTVNSVPVVGTAGTPDANGLGLLEDVQADPDVSTQQTVDAKAQGIIDLQGGLRPIVQVSNPLPNAPQPFSDYDLGDTVRYAINRGAFQVITSPRVQSFTVDVGQNGELATSLVAA
jgi:hypothetical protein